MGIIAPTLGSVNARYTGQREEAAIGLYYYGARWYDPAVGRFIQPDSVVQGIGHPLGLDRYAYVNNNPIGCNDPSGHCPMCVTAIAGGLLGGAIGAIASAAPQMIQNIQSGQPLMADIDPSEVARAAAVGAVAGLVGGFTFGVGTPAMGGKLTATVAAGMVSGAASGQAARATSNALTRRPLGEGLGQLEDLAGDAVAGGALAGIGYGATRALASARLQSLTTRANQRFADNPSLIRGVLNEAQVESGLRNRQVGNMQYGHAVEESVAMVIPSNRLDNALFRHVGGPSRPDFVGRGIIADVTFDITTPAQRAVHLARPVYGAGLRVVKYQRPASFWARVR